MSDRYVIWYCKVTEDKVIGVMVSYPFYGGEGKTDKEADDRARILVNDKSKQATIIPIIIKLSPIHNLMDAKDAASKRFKQMAKEIYTSEELYNRRNKCRKVNA